MIWLLPHPLSSQWAPPATHRKTEKERQLADGRGGEGGGRGAESYNGKKAWPSINYKCTCCLYGAGRNYFDAGKSYFEGYWKGWALKIETFLGPKMAKSEASAMWAKKSFTPSFGAHFRTAIVGQRTWDPAAWPWWQCLAGQIHPESRRWSEITKKRFEMASFDIGLGPFSILNAFITTILRHYPVRIKNRFSRSYLVYT